MSLMSDTQGNPERIWALTKLLAAYEGPMPREGVARCLQALTPRDDISSLVQQTISAAAAIGVVQRDRDFVSLCGPVPSSFLEFTDVVHEYLCNTQGPDRVMFEVFSWYLVQCDTQNGTAWIDNMVRKEFVDRVQLPKGPDGTTATFNPTRVPYWRAWMACLGLGIDASKSSVLGGFFPRPVNRVRRTLYQLGIEHDDPVDVNDFLCALSQKMPYLDRGGMRSVALEAAQIPERTAELSRVLSVTLRELHDEGVIILEALGDASDVIKLSRDPFHKIQNVRTITIRKGVTG